jgi:predicted transcriptional regulator
MTATTIKVSPQTRDRVKAVGEAEHRTADQVVNAALDAYQLEARRRRARADAARLRSDPEDQAEMRRVMEEMEELRAW